MKTMTLREVCDTYGVSRRAIQGYEKAKLVSATEKNERGYLLYNEDSQERIRRIKFFQQMGFSIKEIKELIDAPDTTLKSALQKQVKKLEEEKNYLEITISKIHELIDTL